MSNIDRDAAGSLFNENPSDEVRLDENRRAVPVEGDREALQEKVGTTLSAAAKHLDGAGRSDVAESLLALPALIDRLSALPVEPTPEEFGTAIGLERSRQIEKGYDADHDDKHGALHLINWATDYGRRGETVKVGAMHLALAELLHRQASAVPVEVDPQWKTTPPHGWRTFGSHLERPGQLEFWGEEFSNDGLPLWERPVEVDPRDVAHIACDCVPDLGPEHCHLCSKRAGPPVPWPECSSRLSVEGEVEREYGIRAADDEEPYTDASDDLDWVLDHALLTDGDQIVRRRKAGPWEEVTP